MPSPPSERASAGYFGGTLVSRRFCAPWEERIIAVFSPGSGALDGDAFEVGAAMFFAASFLASLGLLTAGAGVAALAEADGAVAAPEEDDGEAGTAAAGGAVETDGGADAESVVKFDDAGCAAPESGVTAGAGVGAGVMLGVGCACDFAEAGA